MKDSDDEEDSDVEKDSDEGSRTERGCEHRSVKGHEGDLLG